MFPSPPNVPRAGFDSSPFGRITTVSHQAGSLSTSNLWGEGLGSFPLESWLFPRTARWWLGGLSRVFLRDLALTAPFTKRHTPHLHQCLFSPHPSSPLQSPKFSLQSAREHPAPSLVPRSRPFAKQACTWLCYSFLPPWIPVLVDAAAHPLTYLFSSPPLQRGSVFPGDLWNPPPLTSEAERVNIHPGKPPGSLGRWLSPP